MANMTFNGPGGLTVECNNGIGENGQPETFRAPWASLGDYSGSYGTALGCGVIDCYNLNVEQISWLNAIEDAILEFLYPGIIG